MVRWHPEHRPLYFWDRTFWEGVAGCLTLNTSNEPLTITPARRAVRMVLDGKAEILEKDGGKRFPSETRIVPCPAVIRHLF